MRGQDAIGVVHPSSVQPPTRDRIGELRNATEIVRGPASGGHYDPRRAVGRPAAVATPYRVAIFQLLPSRVSCTVRVVALSPEPDSTRAVAFVPFTWTDSTFSSVVSAASRAVSTAFWQPEPEPPRLSSRLLASSVRQISDASSSAAALCRSSTVEATSRS